MYVCRNDNANPLFQNVDRDLRTLVARCMMDEPADRPGMNTIRRVIDHKLGQRYGNNDPDTLRLNNDLSTLYSNLPNPPVRRRHIQQLQKVCLTLSPQPIQVPLANQSSWGSVTNTNSRDLQSGRVGTLALTPLEPK
jgi:hypothetical protein